MKYVQRTGQEVDIIFKDMISMGKPCTRYRTFNDTVSLTIFSTIDNIEFVKFITEVQDKNSKIMPLAEIIGKNSYQSCQEMSPNFWMKRKNHVMN